MFRHTAALITYSSRVHLWMVSWCTWRYLEVHRQLRGVLQSPQRPDQRCQLLRDLSLGEVTCPQPVPPGPAQVQLVALQRQVLGEQVRVAQALDRGVHEAGVAVVLQAEDAWHPVPVLVEQLVSADAHGGRRARGGGGGGLRRAAVPSRVRVVPDDPGAQGARCAVPEPTVVVLRVLRVRRVSKVGQSAQRFDDSVH